MLSAACVYYFIYIECTVCNRIFIFNIEKCSGAIECKKALTLLKAGKLSADFIEGMICEGGCVGGPSRHRSGKNPALVAKDRDKLLSEADNRNVSENLSNYDLSAFSMHK